MSVSDQDAQMRFEWGHQAVIEAAECAQEYFQDESLCVESKADQSFVTVADRDAENTFRRSLEKAFPEDGVIGEEFPETRSKSGFTWIIDPIDGTFSFVHGVPLWGTLLALEKNGEVVAGWVFLPELGEMVEGLHEKGVSWLRGYERNRQAFTKSTELKAKTTVSKLEDAVLCHTSSDYFIDTNQRSLLHTLEDRCRANRCWSDCYSFLLLATSRVDIVVEPRLSYWDYAPFLAICKELSLEIHDFQGKECEGKTSVIACNSKLSREVLSLTAKSFDTIAAS